MARRPQLLYVAWGFPPSRGGGVYRALATANAFARRGWDVTVLTATRDTFERYTGLDTSLEDRVDPSVDVVRVPFDWPLLEADLRRWPRWRMEAPALWARYRRRRDAVSFPETGYGHWRRRLCEAALDIHRRRPVDLVLATANPHVTFAAAWSLHRRHRVPYVLDYRDAWLLDVFSGKRLHEPGSRAARWEARLVSRASEVWYVNEPIRAWHAGLYPDRAGAFHVVANGYDEDLLGEVPKRPRRQGEGLVFGYVGTVSSKVPLAEFIEGWRLARAHPLMRDARAELYGYLGFYATPRRDLEAALSRAGVDGVRYCGPVGKGALATVYQRFDALILLLGAGRYVTSGKVFEYAATGLPIAALHHPDNAATEVLRSRPLRFRAAEVSPEAFARTLVETARAATAVDDRARERALAHGRAFVRELQLYPRVDALREHALGMPTATPDDAHP